MDETTLTALQGSIEKWKGVLAGAEERGWRDCALCNVFANDDDDNADCQGCPVAEKTKLKGCEGSPYSEWSKYQWDNREGRSKNQVFDDKSRELAQAELDFLSSLLPQGESHK